MDKHTLNNLQILAYMAIRPLLAYVEVRAKVGKVPSRIPRSIVVCEKLLTRKIAIVASAPKGILGEAYDAQVESFVDSMLEESVPSGK